MKKTDTRQVPETDAQEQAKAHGKTRARAHFKTAGEKRFDWLAYTGIGYYLNVALSLGAVYWAERTHTGQKFIQSLGQGFEKLGVNRKTAEFLGRRSFFLTGGFAVMPIIKGMEDAKVGMVERDNRKIYGEQVETDPTIRQSERELERAPKQTWGSLISGRLLALAPFYATVGLLWNKDSLLGKATNGWGIDRPISNASRDIGKLLASSGKHFDGHEATGITKIYHDGLSLVGKLLRFLPEDKKALNAIKEAEHHSPGAVISESNKLPHDPNHSTIPYYFISEAITSAMVAWAMYAITRVTGKAIGKKVVDSQADTTAPAELKVAEVYQLPPHTKEVRFTERLEGQQAAQATAAAR